jgi:hypothetical protein
MDRVSSQAIRSMCFIFYHGIKHFEIDKNRVFQDPTLLVHRVFEEIVAKEIDSFLNQISLVFIDIESGFPESKELLEEIRKIMSQELASSELLDKEGYVEKLVLFVNETLPKYMSSFFKEVIDEGKKLNEKKRKYLDPLFGEKVSEMINSISELYEKAEGEPDTLPGMECPLCEKESTNYGCLWYGNKHIHFYCSECGLNMMQ